jgi:hypothetical protein
MTYNTTCKINRAVRECVGRCFRSQTPLTALAEYVEQLKADPSWAEAEILRVETTVLRMVNQVVSQPDHAA